MEAILNVASTSLLGLFAWAGPLLGFDMLVSLVQHLVEQLFVL